ncbi:MAG: ImpA family type VI secretion-associated protein, partial [Parcubacteria group bacterium Gr01-1014_3]
TISAGDIQSAGKLTITSLGTSTLPALTATDINTTSLTLGGTLEVTTTGTSTFAGGISATSLILSAGLHVDVGDAIFDQKITVGSGTSTFAGGVIVDTLTTGTTATSTFGNGVKILAGGLQIASLNCSGSSNDGALTADANGNVRCSDDNTSAAADPGFTDTGTIVRLQTATDLVELADLYVTNSDIFLGNGLQATTTIHGEYGNLGFGTTTPFGQVSIEAVQGIVGSNTPIFVVGDSGSSSPFIYVSGNNGFTGFGTSSPWGQVSIEVLDTGDEDTPSFVIGDEGTSTPALAVYSSGVTVIESLETGAITFDTDAGQISWIDLPVSSSAIWGTAESYTAQVDGSNILTIYAESDGKGGVIRERAGVGTTTPGGLLSVSHSSTTPAFLLNQTDDGDLLTLQAGGVTVLSVKQGGKLALGTTTPGSGLSIATTTNISNGGLYVEGTTTAASFIATSTLSVGTSSPADGKAVFNVGGNAYISGGLAIGRSATTSPGGLAAGVADLEFIQVRSLLGCSGDIESDATGVLHCGTDQTATAGPADLQDSYDASGADAQITTASAKDIVFYLTDQATDPHFILAMNTDSESQFQIARADGAATTTSFIITGDGRVGLGTSTPGAGLSVHSTTTILGLDLYTFGQVTSPNFVATNTAGTSFFQGNVGIATSTISTKLEVGGGVTVKGHLNFAATSTGSSFIATSTLSVGTSSPGTNSQLAVQGNAYIDGGLAVGSSATVTPGHIRAGLLHSETQLVLEGLPSCDTLDTDANGVVKCGTDSSGSAAATDFQDAYNASAADAQIFTADAKDIILALNDTATDPNFVISVAADGQGQLQLAVGSTTNAIWEGYGRLGIGTTTPGAGLSVHATTTILGLDLYAFGQITAPHFVATNTAATSLLMGSLGVGTSSPGQKFAVGGGGLFKGSLAIEATTTTGSLTASTSIGIGTSSPFVQFAVNGNAWISGGLVVGAVSSTSMSAVSASSTGLAVVGGLRLFNVQRNAETAGGFVLCIEGAESDAQVWAAGTAGDDCNNTTDIAEYMTATDGVEEGDVVSAIPPLPGQIINEYYTFAVTKAQSAYDKNAIGVVSRVGFAKLLNGPINEGRVNEQPITLAGRTPVKVSMENGPIYIGDRVTASSEPGKLMKATEPGWILGVALGEVIELGTTTAKVLVLVGPGYWSGDNDSTLHIGGLSIEQGSINAEAVITDLITSKSGQGIGLKLAPGEKFTIFASTTQATTPVITLDADGNATFAGEITASKISAGKIAGLEIITDKVSALTEQINDLSATTTGPISFTDVVGFTSSAEFKADVSVLGNVTANKITANEIEVPGLNILINDFAGLASTTHAIASSTQDLLARVSQLEATGQLDLETMLNVQGGLTVNGLALLNGGLRVDSISGINDAVTLLTDTIFIGRPYFTVDTAGFAVVKAGATIVQVTFEREYLDQPAISATISLNEGEIASSTASAIFANNVHYLVTNKSVKGFTILLNQAASVDIQFSWIALAVKSPKTFESDVSEGEVIASPPSDTSTTTPSGIEPEPVSEPTLEPEPAPAPAPVAEPVQESQPPVVEPTLEPTVDEPVTDNSQPLTEPPPVETPPPSEQPADSASSPQTE